VSRGEGTSAITLTDAAEQLGVHYMTAYRYVRTGRLEAMRRGGHWEVDPASLRALLDSSASTPADDRAGVRASGQRRAKGKALERRILDLVQSLVRGDEPAAWRQVEDFLASGMDPEDLYLDVLSRALREIGSEWERGALSIGDEHRASAVMVRLLGRLGPRFARRGRRRGTIVLGAPAGDRHSLPTALLADPLRGRGFDVVDLGADVPADAFVVAVARADRLRAVGIAATTARPTTIKAAITAVHAFDPEVPVVLGGEAVPDAKAARRWGAQHFTAGAREAVEILDPG
jgi:excisionase family DNA binding protein